MTCLKITYRCLSRYKVLATSHFSSWSNNESTVSTVGLRIENWSIAFWSSTISIDVYLSLQNFSILNNWNTTYNMCIIQNYMILLCTDMMDNRFILSMLSLSIKAPLRLHIANGKSSYWHSTIFSVRKKIINNDFDQIFW